MAAICFGQLSQKLAKLRLSLSVPLLYGLSDFQAFGRTGDYWTPPECGAVSDSDSDFGPVAAASVCNLRQFSLQT